MPRPPTNHSLPLLSPFKFDPQNSKNRSSKIQVIYHFLENIALSHRKATPITFYPVREVSQAYQVSLSTIEKVYEKLEKANLIIRQRGSQTLLKPRQSAPLQKPNGVVGIPVWFYGFCHLSDWRFFHNALEEALLKHNLIPVFIFQQFSEGSPENFALKIMKYQFDYFLWLYPLPQYQMLLDTLRDSGVRVLTIPDTSISFSGATIKIDWKNAFLKALQNWKNQGFEEISIICHPLEGLVQSSFFTDLIPPEQFKVSIHEPLPHEFSRFVEKEGNRSNTVYLIPDHAALSQLCLYGSFALREFISKNRVCVRNRLDMTMDMVVDLKIDMIEAPLLKIAQQIAHTFASGGPALDYRLTLPAIFHERVEATAHAQFV